MSKKKKKKQASKKERKNEIKHNNYKQHELTLIFAYK